MNKLHVAVFFGGNSSEYKVSLESAYAVIKNLDREKYCPVPVGISQEGDWFYFSGDVEEIRKDTWTGKECVPAVLVPGGGKSLLLMRNDFTERIPVDVAFPVLHGKNGEDGTIQGLIELSGIPLAGCGTLASALCMDKERAHKLVSLEGIRVPRGLTFARGEEEGKLRDFINRIGYPLFVKPVKAGSSFGITRVSESGKTEEELKNAMELAFLYDDRIIVEENIDGFETGCAVLGTESLITGEIDEIELSGGFFDFTEKYTLKTSAIHVPARIGEEKSEEIKECARVIYRALGCTGFARVDMFLTPCGEIVFNEVNTIPGFTEHSRYPGMMKAAGFSFSEILEQIIELAVGTAQKQK